MALDGLPASVKYSSDSLEARMLKTEFPDLQVLVGRRIRAANVSGRRFLVTGEWPAVQLELDDGRIVTFKVHDIELRPPRWFEDSS